jgi:hypothetical protein
MNLMHYWMIQVHCVTTQVQEHLLVPNLVVAGTTTQVDTVTMECSKRCHI